MLMFVDSLSKRLLRVPVKCCETLYTQSVLRFLDFKCPSMLAVNLVYIEVTVRILAGFPVMHMFSITLE